MTTKMVGNDDLKRKKNKWLGRLGLCGSMLIPTALFAAPITGALLEANDASPAMVIVIAAAVALTYLGVALASYTPVQPT